jgi:predicted XRE-type DNA-binding protein
MGTQRCLSVWDAIEDAPAQAEGMKQRSVLMMS